MHYENMKQTNKAQNSHLKDKSIRLIVHPKMKMLTSFTSFFFFQTHMNFFSLQNSKKYILKIVGN